MILETRRLLIRQIKQSDKFEIFAYRCDAETNKYQGWIPKTMEDVEIFIDNTATLSNQSDTWFQMAVIAKDDNKIIGDIGIHFLNSINKQVELGYTLDKNYHGEGYASEALISVIDYLFFDLRKHRITASIDPRNKASIRLIKKLGFRKEAHFVKSLFIHGEWVDDLIFALLKDEWSNMKR